MLNLNFAEALAQLGPRAAFEVANQARPPANYLFNTLLPERTTPAYHVESGSMRVRATMAGLVGMDAPYPPGGKVDMATFLEKSAKIANEVQMPESVLRHIQQLLMHLDLSDAAAKERLVEEALNFLDKVIVQAHLDTFEWLRGQALTTGAIDWTFNQIRLEVTYGIPATHLFPTRTTASGEAYGAANSLFWSDVRAARRLLRNNFRAIITHPDTLDEILYNDANNLQILAQADTSFTIQRLIEGAAGRLRPGTDARDTVQLVTYDLEAEVIDPANPDQTQVVPFIAPGVVLFVARNQRSSYRVGEGSTPDPDNDLELGYTHLAPTVEGGSPGRYSDLYTPQNRPYHLVGHGVTNGLPVIEAPDKIVVASTEMS